MDGLTTLKHHLDWASLPLPVLQQIATCLASSEDSASAMRQTCRHWRCGVASLNTALTPLGLPWHYYLFSDVASVDLHARGHGPAADDQELAAVCAAAHRVSHIDLTGAYRIKALAPLADLSHLTHLCLDLTTIEDAHLDEVLPNLALESLSLRGCAFLRGEFLGGMAAAAPQLQTLRRLDLADCALALHMNPHLGRALAAIFTLELLDVGGNAACDATAAALGQLPHLKGLGLRDAHNLTEIGLEDLAAGPAGQTIEILDLERCSGLREGAWAAVGRFSSLQDLSLARTPDLLHETAIPDHAAAALWRWPRLRRLNLAGSQLSATKLKILAATCGSDLVELDISAPLTAQASPARPPFSRLPQRQIQDLVESARSMKQLKALNAAHTGMPLEAAVAFMRAAPRLEALDLSSCELSPRGGLIGGRGVGMGASGRLWSSGVFMPGPAPYRAAVADVSTNLAAPGPEEFALALGALTALHTLRLADCGLTPQHLRHLEWLKGLKEANLGGNRVGDAAADGLVASAAILELLDLSGTGITDAGLDQLANSGLSNLKTLRLARSGRGVTIAGLLAVAAAAASTCPPLRELDISDCPSALARGTAEKLGAAFPGLTSLKLSGGGALGVESVAAAVPMLRMLRSLDLARCGDAVTDDTLHTIGTALWQLTSLNLDGAQNLTLAGLPTLSSLECLADLNLTCCTGLGGDDDVKDKLPEGMVATVQLPQGAKAPCGSPFRRRPSAPRIGRVLPPLQL